MEGYFLECTYIYCLSKTMDFNTFLNELSTKPVRVVAPEVDFDAYIPIDLSVANKALDSLDVGSSTALNTYINKYLQSHQKLIAFGGYLERRSLYNRSAYFSESNAFEPRNIHLGIDFWCAAETAVLAAFDGVIHSYADNTNYGDYGPTVVLKHCVNNSVFYTLYGHLSRSSIKDLNKETQILKNQVIGFVGCSVVNGDYAPHLHFQLIKDIENFKGDYPGVCSEKKLGFYSQNCPDPNLILKLSKGNK